MTIIRPQEAYEVLEDWDDWMFSESHHKPLILWDSWMDDFEDFPDLREPGVFAVALEEAYVGRNINMEGDLTNREWLSLFRHAGFISDGPSLPTAPTTVYRGCFHRRFRAPAWTSDLNVAAWFANRIGHSLAAVWEVTVQPRHILAMFDNRDEHEVVVSPYAPPLRSPHRVALTAEEVADRARLVQAQWGASPPGNIDGCEHPPRDEQPDREVRAVHAPRRIASKR